MNAAVNEVPFYNAVTRQCYSAKNMQLLYEAAMLAGIEDRAVAGFKQWLEAGRVVRKGERGTKIYMVVDKKLEANESADESKFKVLKTRTVFFASQTIPLGGDSPAPDLEPEPAVTPSPPPAAAPAKPAAKNRAPALRTIADNLTGKIESAFGNRLENTPKRRREAASARLEGARLKRTQQALYKLADLYEAGTVPEELASVATKAKVYELCSTVLDSSRCGYYDAPVDTGKPRYQTPDAVALWNLITVNPADAAAEALRRKIATVRQMGIPGFFPTPAAVVERMIGLADIGDGMSICEPSAGDGAIACEITKRYPSAKLDTYEINSTLREVLQARGLNVVGSDFLAGQALNLYDRIVMNPPFEKEADIDQVKRAYSLLVTGGKLVAVMSRGTFSRQTNKAVNFRAWLDDVGADVQELPDNSFASSGTGVSTNLVRITKQ